MCRLARVDENNFGEVQVVTMIIPPPPVDPPPPVTPPPPALAFVPPDVFTPFLPPPIVARLYIDGSVNAYTWHLSVIDAGMPRTMRESDSQFAFTGTLNMKTWNNVSLDKSQWMLVNRQGKIVSQPIFGNSDAIAVPGDYNGDGISEVGVYIRGEWFIDINHNGKWDSEDLWAKLGSQDDLPVVGDWDGDGKDDIGIYGPASA